MAVSIGIRMCTARRRTCGNLESQRVRPEAARKQLYLLTPHCTDSWALFVRARTVLAGLKGMSDRAEGPYQRLTRQPVSMDSSSGLRTIPRPQDSANLFTKGANHARDARDRGSIQSLSVHPNNAAYRHQEEITDPQPPAEEATGPRKCTTSNTSHTHKQGSNGISALTDALYPTASASMSIGPRL